MLEGHVRRSFGARAIGLGVVMLLGAALAPAAAVAETADPASPQPVDAPVSDPPVSGTPVSGTPVSSTPVSSTPADTPTSDVPSAAPADPAPVDPADPSLDPVAPPPDPLPDAVAAATPVLTATPDADLVNGETITVAGSGFTANASVGFAVCTAASSGSANDCDVTNVGYSSTDGTGAFSAPFHVRRILHTANGIVDCASAPDTCKIGAANISDYSVSANTLINFDPTVPLPPPPDLLLIPSATGLSDGQAVGVFGSGFPPNAPVRIEECLPGGVQSACRQLGPAGANGSGGVAVGVTVSRQLHQAFDDPVDCADAIGTCELVVTSLVDPDARGVAPLGFDPGSPPPSPTLEVDPHTGLAYHQRVTVSGSGYFFNGVEVFQCKARATDFGDCRPFPAFSGTGTDDAIFSVPFEVRRIMHLESGTFDCASAPGACDVVVVSTPDQITVRAPIAFDPSAPIPPPAVLSVTPNIALPYRQNVAVHGADFPANVPIQLAQCAAASPLQACEYSGSVGFVFTDEHGEFDTTLPVIRSLRTYASYPPTVVDCASAPATCEVRAFSYQDEDATASVSLTFDPSAPIPTPTVAVTPSTGLADRQIVSVHGEGFLAGDFVAIVQCEDGGTLNTGGCSVAGSRFVQADETGVVDAVLRVHQSLEYYEPGVGGIAEEACGAAPGACVLHVESQLDPSGVSDTPLVFDPDAAPAPLPEMTIHPGTMLKDGQEITIDARGFLPNTQLAAVQCAGPVGDGSGATCGAFAGPLYIDSDENGEVHLTTTAHQTFTPASGGAALDCGYAADNCRLVLAELVGSITPDVTAMVSVTFVPSVVVGGETAMVTPEPGSDPAPSEALAAPALAFTGTGGVQPGAYLGALAVMIGLALVAVAGRRRTRRSL